jgi:hypothetical protein
MPWEIKARRIRIKAGNRRSENRNKRPGKNRRSRPQEAPDGKHSSGVGSLWLLSSTGVFRKVFWRGCRGGNCFLPPANCLLGWCGGGRYIVFT